MNVLWMTGQPQDTDNGKEEDAEVIVVVDIGCRITWGRHGEWSERGLVLIQVAIQPSRITKGHRSCLATPATLIRDE